MTYSKQMASHRKPGAQPGNQNARRPAKPDRAKRFTFRLYESQVSRLAWLSGKTGQSKNELIRTMIDEYKLQDKIQP